MPSLTDNVTGLLIDWNNGDPAALERLMPVVERELRRIASLHMRREDPNHVLQTTALVNELYLKLVDQERANWRNRGHFFALASRLMRRILVDYARRSLRGKRGGGEMDVPIEEVAVISPVKSAELIALDEALAKLSQIDPQKARVVEMRHFGGMSVEETAAVLEVSKITVIRHWNLAKAWLRREVRGEDSAPME